MEKKIKQKQNKLMLSFIPTLMLIYVCAVLRRVYIQCQSQSYNLLIQTMSSIATLPEDGFRLA